MVRIELIISFIRHLHVAIISFIQNEELGLHDRSNVNHYEIIDQQDEKKQESTPLFTKAQRVRADSSGNGVKQLHLTTQLKEASFTTSLVPPQRASEVGQPAAILESAYAEPALLVKPSVLIPPATERSTYSNVENFQNPQVHVIGLSLWVYQ